MVQHGLASQGPAFLCGFFNTLKYEETFICSGSDRVLFR